MTKIQSFINQTAQSPHPAQGPHKTDRTSTTDAPSRHESIPATHDHDRWELFRDIGSSALTRATDAIGRTRANPQAIRHAIAGPGENPVSAGLDQLAQWLQPSSDAVESIRETRTAIQGRVRETINDLDPQPLQQAADQAAENFGSFVLAINDTIQHLQHGSLSVGADYQSTKNSILNAVIEAACNALVHFDDQVEATGQSIQQAATLSPLNALLDSPAAILAYNPMGSLLTATWALEEIGKFVEHAPQLAEQHLNAPPLPTKDNFETWLHTHLEPGESYHHEGGFSISFTGGLGAKLEFNQAWIIQRSPSNPHLLTLTLADDRGAMATLGKEVMGQGKSAGLGTAESTALQFQFDTSDPAQSELMANIVLYNQSGLPDGPLISAGQQYLVSVTQEIKGRVNLALGAGLNTLSINADRGLLSMSEQRRSGQVDRLAFKAQQALDAGNSIGRISQKMLGAAADSATTKERELMARLMAQLNAGELGASAGASVEMTMGIELEDKNLERIFVEANISPKALGFQGAVALEFVVHDPIAIADAMGQSVSDLTHAATSGDLDMASLVDAATAANLDLEDVLGFKIETSTTDIDGLQIDTSLFHLANTIQRQDTQLLYQFGTPIDRTRHTPGHDTFIAADRQGQLRG